MRLQTPVVHSPSSFVTKEELQQFKKNASEIREELKSTLKDLKKEIGNEVKEIGRNLNDQLRKMLPPTFKRTVSGEPICFRCNISGHIGRSCPDLPIVRKCYICNSSTHLANTCD